MSVSYDSFYVLDLDRTLFNTPESAALVIQSVAHFDAQLAKELQAEREAHESRGTSFSLRDYIAKHSTQKDVASVEAHYMQAARATDLLNPGALDLLAYLRSMGRSSGFGILTYGSPLDQRMKIRAVPQLKGVPYLLTQELRKGAQIEAWRRQDGLYRIPDELGGGCATHIVLVDDKPVSFEGLPVDCRGYLVESIFGTGVETLPATIVPVTDLYEVITAEMAPSALR
jgi:hypothetical protein